MLHDLATGEEETVAAEGLFVLIGAHPLTDWLPPEMARDSYGFLLTGDNLNGAWRIDRPPLPSRPASPASSQPATPGTAL